MAMSKRSETRRRTDIATPTREVRGDVWRAARSYLAAELLGVAHICGSLGGVQQPVMVLLELELAARPETAHWRPDEWLVAVEGVLSQQRRAALDAIQPESRSPNGQPRRPAPSPRDDWSTRHRSGGGT